MKTKTIKQLKKENKLLKEQLQEKNIPVSYYKEGGVTYAVYGTSSINYVDFLRKENRRLTVKLCEVLL